MNNDGETLYTMEGLLRKYRIAAKGLILIGSSRLFGRQSPLELGFKQILIIEDDASRLPSIAAIIAGRTNVHLVHAAVAHHAGTRTRFSSDGREHVIYAASLEQILEANQWSLDAFNTLVVSSFTPHLEVLQGAARILPHLELALFESAPSTEVDIRMDRNALEVSCEAFGLACAVEKLDPVEACWRVAYVRRPVVTMSTLGRNGRFANQLFQYLFLRLVAERQNAVLQTPEWLGEEVFGCEAARLLRSPGRFAMESHSEAVPGSIPLSAPAELVTQSAPDFQSTDFWGYFQFHSTLYRGMQGLIRDLFSRRERYAEAEAFVFGKLRSGGKQVVAVHLRRGDYGYDAFFRAPCSWYERWVVAEGLDPERHLIFICSEDAVSYGNRFPGYEVVTSGPFAAATGLEPWLIEFLVLCGSDALAISNSTFSFFAALLNGRANRFARPMVEIRALASFDPWDAKPLFETKLSPDEHLRLSQED